MIRTASWPSTFCTYRGRRAGFFGGLFGEPEKQLTDDRVLGSFHKKRAGGPGFCTRSSQTTCSSSRNRTSCSAGKCSWWTRVLSGRLRLPLLCGGRGNTSADRRLLHGANPSGNQTHCSSSRNRTSCSAGKCSWWTRVLSGRLGLPLSCGGRGNTSAVRRLLHGANPSGNQTHLSGPRTTSIAEA